MLAEVLGIFLFIICYMLSKVLILAFFNGKIILLKFVYTLPYERI